MEIRASAEDYLESILVLQQKLVKVRAIDIVNHMKFSKPTVSIKMKQFKDNGYITIDEEKSIKLTEKGLEIAQCIHERHTILTKVLIAIGVTETQAYEDACKIEHDLSNETFECIKGYYSDITNPSKAN